MALLIEVVGTPAPQGSKRHVGNGVMVESSKRVKPWREDVKQAALDALEGQPIPWLPNGPVAVTVVFYLARPKGHYRTGRNAQLLRDGAPAVPSGRPDLDKLARSTLDALGEAGVWRDDSQVAALAVFKRYANGVQPGADIKVAPL